MPVMMLDRKSNPEVPPMFQLFDDFIVRATDLNRNSGKILDSANRRPITIVRNNEHFALMRRELAHRLATSKNDSLLVVDLVLAVLQLREGSLVENHPFGWLRAFDFDEQNELMNEVISVLRNSDDSESNDLSTVMTAEEVIHEWHESALAILSSTHAAAFELKSTGENVPLEDPADWQVE